MIPKRPSRNSVCRSSLRPVTNSGVMPAGGFERDAESPQAQPIAGRRKLARYSLGTVGSFDREFEGEEKSRTAVHIALGPDAAAVARDDALHVGEPDAGAFEIALVV